MPITAPAPGRFSIDDGRSQAIGELRRDDAGQHVVAAARGERRDQSDRPVRVVLGCACAGSVSRAARPRSTSCRSLMSAPDVVLFKSCAPSQPERIGWPARVGAALEHAALLVGDDRADGAGEPGPVRPPSDLVAESAERLAGRLVDPALQIEQARMIGVRLER